MSQSDIKKFLEGLLVIYQICENVEESKVKETTSNKNLSLFVRLFFFLLPGYHILCCPSAHSAM